jgi:hypothetical protein
MAAAAGLARDFGLPGDAGQVVAVHVNGVPAMPGRDYRRLPDRLRFSRPLAPRRPMGWGRALLVAFCASAEPPGDEVDVTVRRHGRLTTIPLEPIPGGDARPVHRDGDVHRARRARRRRARERRSFP